MSTPQYGRVPSTRSTDSFATFTSSPVFAIARSCLSTMFSCPLLSVTHQYMRPKLKELSHSSRIEQSTEDIYRILERIASQTSTGFDT